MDDSNKKRSFCLTKADLADGIYSSMSVDKQKAVEIVEDYIELIKNTLADEGKVMLSGFGSYEVRHKKSRMGRNPQTGETIILRPRKVVRFKPSNLLRRAINGQSTDDFTEADEKFE